MPDRPESQLDSPQGDKAKDTMYTYRGNLDMFFPSADMPPRRMRFDKDEHTSESISFPLTREATSSKKGSNDT